jgi:hypothetical protein
MLGLGPHGPGVVRDRRRTRRAGGPGRPGSGVPAAEATTEAEAAMALLHEAVGLGYRSPDAFRTEAALDPRRARADFRILMLDLSFPAQPIDRNN